MKNFKKTFKKLPTTNYDEKEEKIFQKLSLKNKRRQSNINNIPHLMSNKLKELLEKNNEESLNEEEEEDIQNISFELSNVNDMDELLDNFSDKSDEKIDLEFQSTTPEEAIELIDDYLQESTKQILEGQKGFDKDAVKLTKDFYNNLVNKIITNETPKTGNIFRMTSKDELISNNEEKYFNIKRKSYMESKDSNMFSESGTSEENTPLFKNNLLAVNDTIQNSGKGFSFASKLKSSSKFILDEIDEDKK